MEIKLTRQLQIDVKLLQKYIPGSVYESAREICGKKKKHVERLVFKDGSVCISLMDEDKNGFSRMQSDLNAKKLGILLHLLPSELLDKFKKSLRGTKLEVPPLSEVGSMWVNITREKLEKADSFFTKARNFQITKCTQNIVIKERKLSHAMFMLMIWQMAM